jgi:UDP:flavonoid glycosyltransferase YjiC (YdhE family)
LSDFSYIGGIAVKSPKDKQLPVVEGIFRRSKKGVILFAMGSLVDTQLMPQQAKTAFVKAFARFPEYSVIWRFQKSLNDSELFSQAPNVFTVDWMDQPTILGMQFYDSKFNTLFF